MLIPDRHRDRHPGHRAPFFSEPPARPIDAVLELTGRRKDGVEFPVQIRLSAFQSGHAQSQTAESLTLLETLLLTAPIGFGFVDRELRIRQMSETLAAVNGLPLKEQLSRTVPEVVPDVWSQIGPIYRHVLDTGEAVVNQEAQGEVRSAPGEVRHCRPQRLESG
jgi:PAS domain-containing protein